MQKHSLKNALDYLMFELITPRKPDGNSHEEDLIDTRTSNTVQLNAVRSSDIQASPQQEQRQIRTLDTWPLQGIALISTFFGFGLLWWIQWFAAIVPMTVQVSHAYTACWHVLGANAKIWAPFPKWLAGDEGSPTSHGEDWKHATCWQK